MEYIIALLIFVLISVILYIFVLRDDNNSLNNKNDKLRKEISELETNYTTLKTDYNELQRIYSDAYEATTGKLNDFVSATKNNSNTDNLYNQLFYKNSVIESLTGQLSEANRKLRLYNQIRKAELENFLKMKTNSMPWLAGTISDYITYDLEVLAKKLDWGHNIQREKKVASIRDIRADAQKRISEAKLATYQLEYLKQLYPEIELVLNSDYEELDLSTTLENLENPLLKYLSSEEYRQLSVSERNQLALDRYISSHKKSKWQIGRDYEAYVGYKYITSGYDVDFYGIFMGKDDLGRDLIAKKNGKHFIVQCKYWSQKKVIHEKHICQLYGTMIEYTIDNNIPVDNVFGVFVTNITLSDRAKLFAQRLNIKYQENIELGDFPRIKCNIGKDQFGSQTKIYHLPMDQQYDTTKIDKPGEFYAFTVKEAEEKGFRHAYKYFG